VHMDLLEGATFDERRSNTALQYGAYAVCGAGPRVGAVYQASCATLFSSKAM